MNSKGDCVECDPGEYADGTAWPFWCENCGPYECAQLFLWPQGNGEEAAGKVVGVSILFEAFQRSLGPLSAVSKPNFVINLSLILCIVFRDRQN